ncbi:MAG: hypothetical protein CVU51_15955, partial [Deltaproteobacteria bacterium HGW-Deltaproteobacteria-1]
TFQFQSGFRTFLQEGNFNFRFAIDHSFVRTVFDIACFFKDNMMISQASCHHGCLSGSKNPIFSRPDGGKRTCMTAVYQVEDSKPASLMA